MGGAQHGEHELFGGDKRRRQASETRADPEFRERRRIGTTNYANNANGGIGARIEDAGVRMKSEESDPDADSDL